MKKEEELLGRWVEDHLKEIPLESPSVGFSDAVMQKIQAEKKAVQTTTIPYRPLISRPVWAAMILGMTALVCLVYFGKETGSPTSAPSWMITAFHWLKNVQIHLPNLTVSQTTGTALLIFSIMALVEIAILQKLFRQKTDRQY